MDIDKFIDYCDNYQIANEKLETNLINHTLAKSMRLYHGSDKDLKFISANSLNMGTRISRRRYSSFWTDNFDYAMVWSLDLLAYRIGLYYMHDIENNKFIIEDVHYIVKKTGERKHAYDILMYVLKENPTYVYSAEIPMKYIGRGQVPIAEYTVDAQVTPDQKTKITPEMAKKIVMVMDTDKFDVLYNRKFGNHKKEKTTFMEKLLFKNPKKTLQSRKTTCKLYGKEMLDNKYFDKANRVKIGE